MFRLQISAAAFSAMCATLPGDVGFENSRAANGDVFIWLPPDVLAKLKAMRGPGDSYSDVIQALVTGDGSQR
jgi:hypothetical protein